ncbi:hypothetical protein [Sorangium sp. So ce887]|uniref:hypothetical protein n=1 Tax=Sorangium sp. So ce887 TaxID=3133324 RepID=UPI003F61EDE7
MRGRSLHPSAAAAPRGEGVAAGCQGTGGRGVERCAPGTAPDLVGARPIRLLTLKARFV